MLVAMDDEGEPAPDSPEAAPPPGSPPKPEIRIRDLTRHRNCSVCGKPKTPYVEIEIDGVIEYTCRECYEGQVIELAACRSCGAAIEASDLFCGKCGAPRVVSCPSCGAEVGEDDRFCGKCGAAFTLPPS